MLDLKAIEKPVWKDYGKDESYQIKYITDEFVRQVAAEAGVDPKNIITQFFEETQKQGESESMSQVDMFNSIIYAVNNEKLVTLIACEAVVEWKGIVSGGEPLPCNQENKALVFEQFSNRARFVYTRCRKEENFCNTNLDDELKNSKPSSVTN